MYPWISIEERYVPWPSPMHSQKQNEGVGLAPTRAQLFLRGRLSQTLYRTTLQVQLSSQLPSEKRP